MSDKQSQIPDVVQQQAWEALGRKLLLPGNNSSRSDDEQELEPATKPAAPEHLGDESNPASAKDENK